MDKRISVTEESLNDILKTLVYMIEESYHNMNSVTKAIDAAEMDGWTDNKFLKFKDEFLVAERNIKYGLKQFEDNLIPTIKKIQNLIDQY